MATHRSRHSTQRHLVPSHTSDPVVFAAYAIVLGQVIGQSLADVGNGR